MGRAHSTIRAEIPCVTTLARTTVNSAPINEAG